MWFSMNVVNRGTVATCVIIDQGTLTSLFVLDMASVQKPTVVKPPGKHCHNLISSHGGRASPDGFARISTERQYAVRC